MDYYISKSMTKGVLLYAAGDGISSEKILEGTGLTDKDFENINEPYSVVLDGIINSNVRRLYNDEDIGKKIGRELYHLGVIPKPLIVSAKLLGTPKLVYREMIKEAKVFNNYVEYEHVEVHRNTARVVTRLKDTNLIATTDCGYEEGIYSAVPILWGMPYADVSQPRCIKKGDPVCEYIISWKGSPSLSLRLKHWLTLRSEIKKTFFAQYDELQRVYRTLNLEQERENDNGQGLSEDSLASIKQAFFEERCDEFSISSREREVIRLLMEGKTRKKIADILFISEKTVKRHQENIYEKCNVHSRHELFKMMQP